DGDGDGGGGPDELDFDFDIPRTETFADNLSAYLLYQGNLADLIPSDDVYVYELSSVLFTDYAKKQRLVKVPAGQQIQYVNDNVTVFPDGTIIAKTFYYDDDFRDESPGKRVIETRVMIMNAQQWNVATYIWNDEQTDTVLELDGATMAVDWISDAGEARSTVYEIPDEVACVTCHQSNDQVVGLGLTFRNLNRTISRDGSEVNQLEYLQSEMVLSGFDVGQIATIVDYNDTTNSLESRARAYLDVNCSHCHNPTAWDEPADEDLDFRYTTPLGETGILQEADEMEELLSDGEMPYIGTTILHDEGLDLLLSYLDSL
ncbi:MAG: hypothetical protein AAGC55_24345, partial [Myxococcota bacterium]